MNNIVSHYTGGGIAALAHMDARTRMMAEHLHIGGHAATRHLMDAMHIGADMHVLDAGCGVGGTARMIASETGARVTGIDLVPAYIDVANAIGGENVEFRVMDAAALDGEIFDAALMLHVGMNISDKLAFYRALHRALKPGALFGIYDVLKDSGEGALRFPLPWAGRAHDSFLVFPDALQSLLRDAGFEILSTENRRAFALESFEKMQAAFNNPDYVAAMEAVHGPEWRERLSNIAAAVRDGLCAPWQIIARRI